MTRPRIPAAALAVLRRVASLRAEPVWLVGGAVRDLAGGRPLSDLDLAGRDAKGLAAACVKEFGGTLVVLDDHNGVYRVVLPKEKGPLQLDCAELQGASIGEDLARRDFTVNAAALALSPKLGASPRPADFLDPRGGLADLARGVLRCEEERLFVEDPLRLLRAFRLAAQHGLSIDEPTLRMIRRRRQDARQPAAERVRAELVGLLDCPGAPALLRLMDECGLLTAVLEELEPARKCAEAYYGPGGVLAHTLAVCERLDFLLTRFKSLYPGQAKAFWSRLAARAPGDAPPRALLMLGALLHDIAKPETAKRVDGRLRFFEHDLIGAERAAAVLKRLRFSRSAIDAVAAVVRHHLRPGHLVSGGGATDKAVYRLFRDLGDDAPSLLAVCWADHASYLPEPRLLRALKAATADPSADGRELARLKPEEVRKTVRHLQLVSSLLRRGLAPGPGPVPERLLDGSAVMKALKLAPGPKVGEALEKLREAQATGKVRTREEALAFLSRLK
ncbi:MAG: HD domain-containing protein [Elusimicrobiota bacterium]|nr:HD domain-containing protein [Elusimicrobiota bacterium]